jgi:hypothetical protein
VKSLDVSARIGNLLGAECARKSCTRSTASTSRSSRRSRRARRRIGLRQVDARTPRRRTPAAHQRRALLRGKRSQGSRPTPRAGSSSRCR